MLNMLTAENYSIMSKLLGNGVSSSMINKMSKLLTSTIKLAPQTNASLKIPYLPYFIGSLANGSRISSAVFYIAMIYLHRLKQKLPESAVGMACTGHRIALAAIIIAEKVVCDIPMKNSAWAQHAKVFSLSEINLMERQLLELLDYRVDIQSKELYNLVLEDQTALIKNQFSYQPPIPVPQAHMKGIYHAPLTPTRFYVPEQDSGSWAFSKKQLQAAPKKMENNFMI